MGVKELGPEMGNMGPEMGVKGLGPEMGAVAWL